MHRKIVIQLRLCPLPLNSPTFLRFIQDHFEMSFVLMWHHIYWLPSFMCWNLVSHNIWLQITVFI